MRMKNGMKDLPLVERNEMLKENQLFCHFSRYVLSCIFWENWVIFTQTVIFGSKLSTFMSYFQSKKWTFSKPQYEIGRSLRLESGEG